MKKLMLISGAVLLFGISALANIFVDGGFANPITIYEAGDLVPNDMDDNQSNPINQGWVAQATNATDLTWGSANNFASRTLIQKNNSYGLAQIVSNSGAGVLNSNEEVSISFSYNIPTELGNSQGFSYRLFGIKGTGGTWDNHRGIRMSNDDYIPTNAVNHAYTQLDHLAKSEATTSGFETYSASVTLGDQYDYFGIVFYSDYGDSAQQPGVQIGNVGLEAVPEPATLGMVAFVAGGLLFIRRKFMI